MRRLIFLILICIVGTLSYSMTEKEYLRSNVKYIDLDSYEKESFSYLDDEVKSKVFFSGEYHGFEENYKMRLQLIKYFYEEHGIRRYMGELGYSSGYFLNKYLDSGDIRYLDIVNYSLEGSYDFSVDDYEFWQELHRYNKTLPEGKKIKIYGLDMEVQYWIALLAVDDMLKKIDIEDVAGEEKQDISRVKNLFREVAEEILPPGDDPKNIYRNVERIMKEGRLRSRRGEIIDAFKVARLNLILGKSSAPKYYSPEEMVDLEAMVFNSLNTLEFLRLKSNEEIYFYIRERFIFENFIRLFKAFPKDDFYGQWGRFHISGRTDSNEVRFAQLVEDFAPNFYRNITAIDFLYYDKKHPDYKKKGVRHKLKILGEYIPEGVDAAIFDMRNLPKESKLLDVKERRYIKFIVVINAPEEVEMLE